MDQPMLRVRGASKSYGSRRALDGVSVDLCSGRICGLTGANGAGKTTLIRSIMGLLRLFVSAALFRSRMLSGGKLTLRHVLSGRGGVR